MYKLIITTVVAACLYSADTNDENKARTTNQSPSNDSEMLRALTSVDDHTETMATPPRACHAVEPLEEVFDDEPLSPKSIKYPLPGSPKFDVK